YPINGMNDIIRFNVSNYIQKMDNPKVPLFILSEEDSLQTVEGEKIYYINFILQFKHEDQSEYKRYRIVLNRNGISEIETFTA
ncbi:MAG: hypothetical protein PHX54_11990, partial [Lentimicrobiaceae bacterium]|nr:hypothetical protein [Lentimicrobiaceae bacterium]